MNHILKLFFTVLTIILISIGCYGNEAEENTKGVKTGADLLITNHLDLLKNRNLGIVTNHTGVLRNGTHLVDTLFASPNIKIKALFGPEHGIRGNAPAGEHISGSKDTETGISVFSLYGDTRKPTPEMLDSVDLLIYDIQDIGARFYTYISTLYLLIEASAENRIPVIVLDRPNPIGGLYVDGPVLDKKLKSFVGIAPLPIAHGMTSGELANMFNDLIFESIKMRSELTIIKMENYNRELYYDQCGLEWIKPSPNMTDLNTALVYPGLCLLEATNVSEGRGTDKPFLKFGAPYINADTLVRDLNKLNLPGVLFKKIYFTPKAIPGVVSNPKYMDLDCEGAEISITSRKSLNAVKLGIYILSRLQYLYPQEFEIRPASMNRLFGRSDLENDLKGYSELENIYSKWAGELEKFKNLRKKYLLY